MHIYWPKPRLFALAILLSELLLAILLPAIHIPFPQSAFPSIIDRILSTEKHAVNLDASTTIVSAGQSDIYTYVEDRYHEWLLPTDYEYHACSGSFKDQTTLENRF